MIYRHVQAGWFTIVALGAAAVMIAGLTVVAGFHWIVLVPTLVIALTVLTFSFMTVTVDDTAVEAKMGIGLVRRRVPLQEIVHFRTVRNPWHYGWGVRLYGGGKLYNVSGLSAVELLLTTGRAVRFGTDEPEVLLAAIERAAGPRPPLSPRQVEESRIRSKAGMILMLLLLGIPLSMSFYGRTQPPAVSMTATLLRVEGGGYGAEVPLRAIRQVTLEQSLPEVKSKVKGLNLFGMQRGRFVVDDMGEGQLFVDRAYPPFVLVRTANGFVAFNLPDEAQTRALYDKLVDARR
jgi:hypothetical protein